jgi:hypothetical protein
MFNHFNRKCLVHVTVIFTRMCDANVVVGNSLALLQFKTLL